MRYFIVDAFSQELFRGNPAGVCLLDAWLEDEVMQRIAAENNLSETAFSVRRENGSESADYDSGSVVGGSGSEKDSAHKCAYDLRWFTPVSEINLCGHATLATAFIITRFVDQTVTEIAFYTKSGVLTVKKCGDAFEMDFPSWEPKPIPITALMEEAIGACVLEAYLSRDMLLLVADEQTVRELDPDPALAAQLPDCFCVIATAKGDEADFVSRVFVPNEGIFEDPVTGSTHSTLIPFWAQRLQKDRMESRQLSKRGGTLLCEYCGDRVKISGQAVLYLQGEILV
ncbi:MAG: PhzF family phenazine biosynthesis protein [Coriobacteriia bacterium]|nr:PhzF family phenazine biosynthesis protein [Coriobacteriia bacterium]